jgi:hypothetical protein
VTAENLVTILKTGGYEAVDTRKASRGWPFGTIEAAKS